MLNYTAQLIWAKSEGWHIKSGVTKRESRTCFRIFTAAQVHLLILAARNQSRFVLNEHKAMWLNEEIVRQRQRPTYYCTGNFRHYMHQNVLSAENSFTVITRLAEKVNTKITHNIVYSALSRYLWCNSISMMVTSETARQTQMGSK